MSLDEIIYINNLPTLDLHALTSDEARVKTLEFINDNKILKNEIICIIHGIGSGILKNVVHQTLKTNKNVIDYKLAFNNVGCTIAKININN